MLRATPAASRAISFSCHAEVGLQPHVVDIARWVLERDLRQVTLLGHSYGGSLITAVADQIPERIAALIYLDAIIRLDFVRGHSGAARRDEYSV